MGSWKEEDITYVMKDYHDQFKHHPYLLNFDEEYFKSFYDMFYKVAQVYFQWRHECVDREKDSTPQECVIGKIWHNLSASMYPARFKKDIGKNVAQVEMFLMMIHQIINGEFDMCRVRNPYDWFGYEAVKGSDGKWRCVITCYEKDRERCIRSEEHWLEYSRKHDYESAVVAIEKQIAQLKAGEKLTDSYKIYDL